MLKLLSYIYSYFVNQRNVKFDLDKKVIYKAKAKVISVGNISVGGSGKTPVVIMLAIHYNSLGFKVAIVGSGYKRKGKGLIVVSNYDEILSNANEAGDEMYLISTIVPNSPVIIDRKKVNAVKYADMEFKPDIIIIDDGFQHRYVYRDVNLLIIDKRTVEQNYTLPYGRLREPIKSIYRANVVILRDKIDLPHSYEQFVNKSVVFQSNTKINRLYYLSNKEEFINLNEKLSVITVCGLALPENFIKFVIGLNFKVEYSFNFKDHFLYTEDSVQQIIKKCNQIRLDVLFTTEKDAVKLKEFIKIFDENNIKIIVMPIEIELQNENEFYKLINELFN
jgi:tetraacyldisaccharide 4'-kinase